MDDRYRYMRDIAFFIGGMLFVIIFGGCAQAPSAVGRAMPHYLPHQGIAFQYPMRLLSRDEKGITWMDC